MDDVQFWDWRGDDYRALLKRNREEEAALRAALGLPAAMLEQATEDKPNVAPEGADGPSVA
jgi:hypothetical protein